MIIVKYSNIDIIDDDCIPHYLDLLPSFMSREILRYKYSADQKSRLLSRLILRECLLGTDAINSLEDWKRDANNKPVIDHWNAFNITHASNFVVFAYTTNKTIGIDIEKKIDVEYYGIMESFHAEEQQFIRDSLDIKNNFYKIWVKKEAVLKAVGVGIVKGLNHFSCIKSTVNYQGRNWYLKELQIHPDYACYLCSLNLNEKIIVQEFKLNLIK